VFGSFRVLGDDMLSSAGESAEGLEAVFPFDPTRDDPAWVAFNQRFEKRFGRRPEAFASLAYDTMNILLEAICRAGLNRGLIRDALYGLERYKGVTGEMIFDPNAKNIAPLYLGTVHGGKATFRRYTMEKPYAALKDQPVEYAGPAVPDSQPTVGIFGPQADAIAATLHQAGYRFVGVPSEQAWGKSSTALVDLVYQQNAVSLIATDRASAHLAEQIAVKTFVPVIALSADRTLTSTNIPWIFRLAPETSVQKAVECLSDAVSHVGLNRGRIREYLASGPFDSNGELSAKP